MTKLQRQNLADLLAVPYTHRLFENRKISLVNQYNSKTFDFIRPVKIRNTNTKLAIKLWKLL